MESCCIATGSRIFEPDTRMDQSGLSINSWFVMIITGEKNEFLEARRISEFRRAEKMTLLLFFFNRSCSFTGGRSSKPMPDSVSFSTHAGFFFPSVPCRLRQKVSDTWTPHLSREGWHLVLRCILESVLEFAGLKKHKWMQGCLHHCYLH